MAEIAQDLRYTFRTLRRDLGFAAVSVLILALGIGANTAVFSVVNATLLRPLPFRDPGRLVWITGGTAEDTGLSSVTYEVLALEEFRRANRSFADLTGYFAFFGYLDYKLTGYGEPERLVGVDVAENLFPMLGVQPALGRLFLPQECQLNGPRAVLLSNGFWKRRFGGDPGVIGRKLTLNDQPATVVGVMPASSDFASIFAPGAKVDIYVPAVMDRMRGWGNTLALIGRLKPGVSVEQARADFGVFLPQLNKIHRGWGSGYKARLMPLQDYVSGRMRRPMIVLWFAVGVVMLIMCTNLSNLLLARAASRTKEFAVRSALGAGRGRLVRQLLTESLVLSGAGAVLGLGLAYAMTRQLARTAAIAMPLLKTVGIDGAALAFTGVVAVVSAVLFGLVPALRLSNTSLRNSLADSGRGSSEGKGHGRIRAGLVVAEIGLACTLLVGAGLLLRSLYELLNVNLGFQPSRAAALRIDFNNRGNTEQTISFLNEVVSRVRAVPGIESVGFTDALPLDRNRSWGIRPKGKVYPGGRGPTAFVDVIGPGYLEAMGIRLVAGRKITEQDTLKSERVILINETTARRLWPGEDALGQTANVGGTDCRVAGIVGDVRRSSLEEDAGIEVYLPFAQAPPASAELVLRTQLPPAAMGRAVREALRSIDPTMPASDFRPLQQFVDRAVSPRRFITSLLAGFAGLALVLASLGIYGVISYSVTQRTQEIGIRMALGATPAQVRMSVIGSTLLLAAIGIVIGGLAAMAATRLIGSMLYGVEPRDVYTFGATVVVLGVVALAAGYFPARRASRTDPISALRNA